MVGESDDYLSMTYYRTATSRDHLGPYDVVVKTRPPVTIEEGLIGTRIQFGVATSAPDSLMGGTWCRGSVECAEACITWRPTYHK